MPPPPADPRVLAEEAIARLNIPKPAIHLGPDDTRIAVNLWTWLWTDDPGTLTVTAVDRSVSVTVTASLDHVTWQMGEPATGVDTRTPTPAEPITCTGPGRPYDPDHDTWKTEPPCGYKYKFRSTKDRTGGVGAWAITATATWRIAWTANTGPSGVDTMTTTSTGATPVGEYRIALVDGGG